MTDFIKHGLLALAALTLGAMTGCASLPEGAQRPALNIDHVRIAQEGDRNGFSVDFSVLHHSEQPLEVDRLTIEIKDPTTTVGYLSADDDFKLAPGTLQNFSRFVPFTGSGQVAHDSLATPMLKLMLNVELVMNLVGASKDSGFNPVATYKGVTGHD